MDRGKVVQSGSYAELIAQEGLFADLVLMPAIVAGPLGRYFVHGVKLEAAAAQSTEQNAESLRTAA